MSSRALRKAQREQEEQEQLRRLQDEPGGAEEDEQEDGPATKKSAFGAFAMLGDQEEDGNHGSDEEEEGVEEDGVAAAQPRPNDASDEQEKQPKTTKSSKKMKKKKKNAKAKANKAVPPPSHDSLDEIDLALKSLSTRPSSDNDHGSNSATMLDPVVGETCRLLSIDASHLHASNEMRRLFGRAALDRDDDDNDAAGGRRRNRGQQQELGLAAALRGRPGAGGRTSGLAALSLRRNIFVQGKEEWPVATSGGLGMELVEKRPDGTVEYRYSHTRPYQGVQREFETCVASMDPDRMVQLLQYNPYHISTLLQVSDIAKQQSDHATSGDLLERALFSLGRCLHSTFASNLAQGKARMDFRRPENREFWLAACRYIANLGMRSTWRTVYEWSKLLLSLDPENDPYCMALVLDQYALRARSQQHFLDLASSSFFSQRWSQLPNIQLSKGLALVQTAQDAKGKQALFTAVTSFPFVVARLLQELDIDAPFFIWGKQPRTASEKMHSELYATRAKDLWNTPEASSLLAEVSSAVTGAAPDPPVDPDKPITLNEARHVLMSDTPALISNLPRSLTAKFTSASDPLPPDDNLPTYTPVSPPDDNLPLTQPLGTREENIRELEEHNAFLANLLPWLSLDLDDDDDDDDDADQGQQRQAGWPTQDEIERRIHESGVSRESIAQRMLRMNQLSTSIDAREAVLADDPGDGGLVARAMEGWRERNPREGEES